jgi:hypothetical protein
MAKKRRIDREDDETGAPWNGWQSENEHRKKPHDNMPMLLSIGAGKASVDFIVASQIDSSSPFYWVAIIMGSVISILVICGTIWYVKRRYF